VWTSCHLLLPSFLLQPHPSSSNGGYPPVHPFPLSFCMTMNNTSIAISHRVPSSRPHASPSLHVTAVPATSTALRPSHAPAVTMLP
jgi:hypothetical protein